MKKFIIQIIKYFTVLVAVFVLLYFILLKILCGVSVKHKDDLHSWNSHEVNVYESFKKIENCKEKKIVIIGGSNTSFGFDSELIFDSYQTPVFNTGTHAGIGLRLQIEFFKSYFKKDDIIIIAPEYEQFFGEMFFGDCTMLRITSMNPQWLNKISFCQYVCSAKYVKEALEETLISRGTGIIDGPYGKNSLNTYGDITAKRSHKNIKSTEIKDGINRAAINYLKDFMAECPASVILLPPVFQDKSYDLNENKIMLVDSILKINGIGFQASPYRYRFNDTLMFDTPYHCTSEGAVIRTKMVIEDMQRILGN